jgi:hypothetical protein
MTNGLRSKTPYHPSGEHILTAVRPQLERCLASWTGPLDILEDFCMHGRPWPADWWNELVSLETSPTPVDSLALSAELFPLAFCSFSLIFTPALGCTSLSELDDNFF